MENFVHLHVHSEYSLLDGACRIEKLIARAKELGQPAVAITDHGVMSGVIDFYKQAKKNDIKPIIGCEVYVARRTMRDKVHKIDNKPYHLVLLCENNQGYQNLIKLVSQGFIEGFYSKPRIDKDLLKQHTQGLIALSACLAGEIPQKLLEGDYEGAKESAEFYRQIFGRDNFFIEVQNHDIPEQKAILPNLVRLSEETGIGLVATNDAHYIAKEDWESQKILVCIQTNHTIDEDNGMEFSTKEFYIKSREEMEEALPNLPSAMDNTVKIAQRCNVEFTFGELKLPRFITPDGSENEDFFMRVCMEGLKKYYGENPEPSILQRLEYEISIIKQMGYIDFYLITYDFIKYAKDNGIAVGPGRGSGAGSLAAYCMGITGMDPIRYNLIFERFLNPERVTMPDFDIDFCYERRQEVIDYVIRKYGKDHVSQIITFGTMAARAAIRDVGRALAMPYGDVDKIAKLIPMELNITIDKAMKVSAELRGEYEKDAKVSRLIDTARAIEGMPRHASTHAAGVVLTPNPVDTYVPLQTNDEAIVTQFAKETVEELGLLKIDFLGLRTLTVIDDTCKMIRKSNPNFQIEAIDIDDQAVYKMISKGDCLCVFQMESAGMRSVLAQLKPTSIEDITAVISLYRPGPMESIPLYVRNKNHPEQVTYKHPLLEDILEVTYGCIVYQEQVMQICRTLAGFSYGRADLVRRAMAKKKAAVMENERNNFIYGSKDEEGNVICTGCIANGVDEATANSIFDEMSSFAAYAFNKSHAACYALLAYQTAYLKYYYPKEFMAAILTSFLDNSSKVTEYIAECKRMGIPVMPPDVNESENGFTVSGDTIRFGLLAVKNIGRGFIKDLIAERTENGKFTSLYDFCNRMFEKDMNKRTVESMIKCGALDSFPTNRRQMLQSFETMIGRLQEEKRSRIDGQMNFFETAGENIEDSIVIPPAEEFSQQEIVMMEKETTGLYITGHPMDKYEDLCAQLKSVPLSKLQKNTEYKDGRVVLVVAAVASRQNKATRNGDAMAFIGLEDRYGSCEALVFPQVLQQCSHLLIEQKVIAVRAKVSMREEEEPKLIVMQVYDAQDPSVKQISVAFSQPRSSHSAAKSQKSGKKVYLKLANQEDEKMEKVKALLQAYKGSCPVYFFFTDSAKYMLSGKNLWCELDDTVLKALKNVLGEENVVVK